MDGLESLAVFLGSVVTVGGLVTLAYNVGDRLAEVRTVEIPGSTSNTSVKSMLLGLVGLFIGGLVGFLLRPIAPLMGQLDFGTVITRGSKLKGLDQLLVSTAETSFNYLLVGAILGALIGLVLGYFIFKKNETTTKAAPA